MLATLLAVLAMGHQKPSPETYRILFLGNSHTAYNDLTTTTAALLQSSGAKVEFAMFTGGHLDDLEPRPDVRKSIDNGRWTHVVLQGAMISSSHKYEYSQAAGIALAQRAVRAGAKPLYFSEWPRRGWNESDYIYKHYEIIRKEAGGENVPICYAWDAARSFNPRVEFWSPDGNHSNSTGAYLAAATIAYWIAGPGANLNYVPRRMDKALAASLLRASRSTVATYKRL